MSLYHQKSLPFLDCFISTIEIMPWYSHHTFVFLFNNTAQRAINLGQGYIVKVAFLLECITPGQTTSLCSFSIKVKRLYFFHYFAIVFTIQCVYLFRVLSSSESRDFDVQTTHQR